MFISGRFDVVRMALYSVYPSSIHFCSNTILFDHGPDYLRKRSIGGVTALCAFIIFYALNDPLLKLLNLS